jgi:tetratricopeptide (TPR) repeat protein
VKGLFCARRSAAGHSMDKTKSPNPKNPPAAAATTAKAAPPPVAPTPPLFRSVDWLTFAIVTLMMLAGYYLTLAPDLTLEDSGELATGAFYAGIPHPPGYPVWTIYTHFWSMLPFGNVAWRVALGEATAAAFACGLLGLLASRGSSMLVEGIEDLRALAGRWENAICVVAGLVAGGLLGFNGYMWSQSVIVEVYSFGVLSLMLTLTFLLRWIHAPHQFRYLYWSMFLFGICFTNHQTLIVAAMGIEVAIAAAHPRLGREIFLGNALLYFVGLVLKGAGMITSWDSAPGQLNMVFVIFNFVGIGSIAAYVWLAIQTSEIFNWRLFLRGLLCGLLWVAGAAFYLYMPIAGMSNPPMQWGYPRIVKGFVHALTRGQYEKTNPTNFLTDPLRFVNQLGMLREGVTDEFSWVFVFLALVPFFFLRRMKLRERAWIIGLTAIYLCLGVLLMILINPPPDRAARELVRVFFTASHVCVALLVSYGIALVTAYMATHYTVFRRWGLIGGGVAVALAVYGLAQAVEEPFGEKTGLFAGIAEAFAPHQYGLPVFAGLLLLFMTVTFVVGLLLYRQRAPLAVLIGVFALMPGYSAMKNWFDNEERGHLFGYWFGHDMFTPPFKGPDGKLTYDPKRREQMMKDPVKGKLIYPEMARNAVLYGGTDPGRFCPTYTIFCESFIPPRCKPRDPNYDRRDVYIITQNALADETYLMYIRAHYNKSDQVQYDSPFFQELLRSTREVKEGYSTNFLARLAGTLLDRPFTALGNYIEKRRRAGSSYFTAQDFTGDFAGKLRDDRDPLSQYLYENLRPGTQKLLADKSASASLNRALAADLNVLLERELDTAEKLAALRSRKISIEEEFAGTQPSESQTRKLDTLKKQMDELTKQGPLYDPARFAHVKLSEYLLAFLRQNPQSHTRIRLNRMLLEEAYPGLIAKSPGGVYPDREILIATPEDSQRCFQTYLEDAQKRLRHDAQFPNEPRQIKLGEDVHLMGEGTEQRVQVSGQVAVMSINGLLTKVMFDKNPENEFYVEESFPLEWMYDYLTPFGVIMKIERKPLPYLTEEILQRDHEFWSDFSERLIGNWITYDTPVKDIVKFAEDTYLRRNFAHYKGDLKFARDDQAQKAFSKLRSSIAGVYAWRIGEVTSQLIALQSRPPQEQAALRGEIARLSALRQRMIKETDFAFRQAFAFCPYSPEAVFRYCQLLTQPQIGRYEDAYLIAETCRKLDPYNANVVGLANQLRSTRSTPTASAPSITPDLAQMEKAVAAQPENFQAAFNLAATYLNFGQTNRAVEILDRVSNHPKAEGNAFSAIVQAYASMGNTAKLQELSVKLEAHVRAAPRDLASTLALAQAYRQLQQLERATPLLDQVLNDPQVDANSMLTLTEIYVSLGNFPKIEAALEKLVKLSPTQPEAWYDLAAVKAALRKDAEAIPALRKAIQLSTARLKTAPDKPDLRTQALADQHFNLLRQNSEFKSLVAKP